ncbi:hypothetical protein [Nocardia sp. NPDC049526]|uniref:hypothetical protein n=1 Tax=Nocardia sp. NPDC049526 TaxID=3364316 RepID=UPI00378E9018
MTSRRYVGPMTLLASLAAVALTVTACGSDSTENSKKATSSSISAVTPGNCPATGKYPASPTVATLDELLRKGLDPNVPSAEKVDLVQGGREDPELFNRMQDTLRQMNFTARINKVTDYCDGTAIAEATLTFNGTPNDAQIPLVAEDGRWKLDQAWGCGMVASLGQTSPACH